MLIPNALQPYKGQINGVLHIGAHACEERDTYLKLGLTDNDILWVEGNPDLVDNLKKKYPTYNIIQALVSDKIEDKHFIVTNNYESSSIFELGTHKKEHPHIHEIERKILKTTTIKNIYNENNIDYKKFNCMNVDVQGAELLALYGMEDILDNFHFIYCEINEKELYIGCALFEEVHTFLKSKGFMLKMKKITKFGWGDALFVKL